MVRDKWGVLYAGVSVLVASRKETLEGWKIWLRSGEKGKSGLGADIRDYSPHLMPQVSSYVAKWQRRKALFMEEWAVAGRSKGIGK